MGCVLSKEDYEEDLKKYKLERKYSPSIIFPPLPIIEPIVVKKIICERRICEEIICGEKIKDLYYIEYNKQNDGGYKG